MIVRVPRATQAQPRDLVFPILPSAIPSCLAASLVFPAAKPQLLSSEQPQLLSDSLRGTVLLTFEEVLGVYTGLGFQC